MQYRVDGLKAISRYLLFNDAKRLEKCIYKYTIEYMKLKDVDERLLTNVYNTKLYEIVFNFDFKNNSLLLVDVVNKTIPIEIIPYLDCSKLNSLLWEPILKKREYIEFKKNNLVTSDAYKCKRCNESKCMVYQMQTRSADEPMTTIVICQNCNNTFRFY